MILVNLKATHHRGTENTENNFFYNNADGVVIKANKLCASVPRQLLHALLYHQHPCRRPW